MPEILSRGQWDLVTSAIETLRAHAPDVLAEQIHAIEAEAGGAGQEEMAVGDEALLAIHLVVEAATHCAEVQTAGIQQESDFSTSTAAAQTPENYYIAARLEAWRSARDFQALLKGVETFGPSAGLSARRFGNARAYTLEGMRSDSKFKERIRLALAAWVHEVVEDHIDRSPYRQAIEGWRRYTQSPDFNPTAISFTEYMVFASQFVQEQGHPNDLLGGGEVAKIATHLTRAWPLLLDRQPRLGDTTHLIDWSGNFRIGDFGIPAHPLLMAYSGSRSGASLDMEQYALASAIAGAQERAAVPGSRQWEMNVFGASLPPQIERGHSLSEAQWDRLARFLGVHGRAELVGLLHRAVLGWDGDMFSLTVPAPEGTHFIIPPALLRLFSEIQEVPEDKAARKVWSVQLLTLVWEQMGTSLHIELGLENPESMNQAEKSFLEITAHLAKVLGFANRSEFISALLSRYSADFNNSGLVVQGPRGHIVRLRGLSGEITLALSCFAHFEAEKNPRAFIGALSPEARRGAFTAMQDLRLYTRDNPDVLQKIQTYIAMLNPDGRDFPAFERAAAVESPMPAFEIPRLELQADFQAWANRLEEYLVQGSFARAWGIWGFYANPERLSFDETRLSLAEYVVSWERYELGDSEGNELLSPAQVETLEQRVKALGLSDEALKALFPPVLWAYYVGRRLGLDENKTQLANALASSDPGDFSLDGTFLSAELRFDLAIENSSNLTSLTDAMAGYLGYTEIEFYNALFRDAMSLRDAPLFTVSGENGDRALGIDRRLISHLRAQGIEPQLEPRATQWHLLDWATRFETAALRLKRSREPISEALWTELGQLFASGDTQLNEAQVLSLLVAGSFLDFAGRSAFVPPGAVSARHPSGASLELNGQSMAIGAIVARFLEGFGKEDEEGGIDLGLISPDARWVLYDFIGRIFREQPGLDALRQALQTEPEEGVGRQRDRHFLTYLLDQTVGVHAGVMEAITGGNLPDPLETLGRLASACGFPTREALLDAIVRAAATTPAPADIRVPVPNAEPLYVRAEVIRPICDYYLEQYGEAGVSRLAPDIRAALTTLLRGVHDSLRAERDEIASRPSLGDLFSSGAESEVLSLMKNVWVDSLEEGDLGPDGLFIRDELPDRLEELNAMLRALERLERSSSDGAEAARALAVEEMNRFFVAGDIDSPKWQAIAETLGFNDRDDLFIALLTPVSVEGQIAFTWRLNPQELLSEDDDEGEWSDWRPGPPELNEWHQIAPEAIPALLRWYLAACVAEDAIAFFDATSGGVDIASLVEEIVVAYYKTLVIREGQGLDVSGDRDMISQLRAILQIDAKEFADAPTRDSGAASTLALLGTIRFPSNGNPDGEPEARGGVEIGDGPWVGNAVLAPQRGAVFLGEDPDRAAPASDPLWALYEARTARGLVLATSGGHMRFPWGDYLEDLAPYAPSVLGLAHARGEHLVNYLEDLESRAQLSSDIEAERARLWVDKIHTALQSGDPREIQSSFTGLRAELAGPRNPSNPAALLSGAATLARTPGAGSVFLKGVR